VQFGAAPNTQVCPVCVGLPGSLPMPNARAIELALRTGVALQCQIRTHSVFARKNYFYPDLAKNYQISQYELPLCEHGRLHIDAGEPRDIPIQRIHLEEDAAKNLHGASSGTVTLVDYNRGGTPLMEIVSGPDLRSSAEAEDYLKRLHETLMFLGVNDGNLEEGSFRCDANVSIRPVGETKLGTRVELKNINSFRFVRKAIDYEVARQIALVSAGGKVVQETRTWSEAQGKTLPMRSKEEAMDYRYFPDPDLPPLHVSEAAIEAARRALPELPEQKRARYLDVYGLTAADAGVLTGHPALAAFFEKTAELLTSSSGAKLERKAAGKKAANFIQAELLRHAKMSGLTAELGVSPEQVAELLALVESAAISGKQAKALLPSLLGTDQRPEQLVREQGLAQVSDTSAIEAAVRDVLAQNPDNVKAYRAGKTAVLGFFVGQVMKAMKGAGNPKLVNEVLQKLLSEGS
jgi:aspartyl-tRNA(Asn)/glutamyl-tRNA(Gln) amidotransferase subunit B